LGDPNTYDFISSISSGQAFTNIRITLPILFLGVWQASVNHNRFTNLFLNLIYNLTLLNSALICFGAVFDVSVFESYPASGRWGYSGFLARGYSVILSSIFLIDLLRKQHFNFINVLFMVVALLCSGTKAGLLSFGFIVFIVMIKKKRIRFGIAGVGAILLVTLPKWMPWLVSFDVFWKQVYSAHGAWGVLFSLRNENLIMLKEILIERYSLFDWLLGGEIRFEELWVEMHLFDLFVFYGLIGLIILSNFFIRIIPTYKDGIPVLVSLLSGAFLTGSFAVICYGVWLISSVPVCVNKSS
jgi:hypothetical protein